MAITGAGLAAGAKVAGSKLLTIGKLARGLGKYGLAAYSGLSIDKSLASLFMMVPEGKKYKKELKAGLEKSQGTIDRILREFGDNLEFQKNWGEIEAKYKDQLTKIASSYTPELYTPWVAKLMEAASQMAIDPTKADASLVEADTMMKAVGSQQFDAAGMPRPLAGRPQKGGIMGLTPWLMAIADTVAWVRGKPLPFLPEDATANIAAMGDVINRGLSRHVPLPPVDVPKGAAKLWDAITTGPSGLQAERVGGPTKEYTTEAANAVLAEKKAAETSTGLPSGAPPAPPEKTSMVQPYGDILAESLRQAGLTPPEPKGWGAFAGGPGVTWDPASGGFRQPGAGDVITHAREQGLRSATTGRQTPYQEQRATAGRQYMNALTRAQHESRQAYTGQVAGLAAQGALQTAQASGAATAEGKQRQEEYRRMEKIAMATGARWRKAKTEDPAEYKQMTPVVTEVSRIVMQMSPGWGAGIITAAGLPQPEQELEVQGGM